MLLNDEQFAQLQARRDEAVARHERLADEPGRLHENLQESERSGDIRGADDAEKSLARHVGVIEAAKFRADVLTQMAESARRERRQAASQEAAANAEFERMRWRAQGLDGPPGSPEFQRQRVAATAAQPGCELTQHIDVAGGNLTPGISGADAARLAARRASRPIF